MSLAGFSSCWQPTDANANKSIITNEKGFVDFFIAQLD
jgi:hypothetical protein